MGYLTEVFLVRTHRAPPNPKPSYPWLTRDDWCHAERCWGDLPADARVWDNGGVVASIDLGKANDGPLAAFFNQGREEARAEKKYVGVIWHAGKPGPEDNEWVELTDPYGSPLVLHSATATLEAVEAQLNALTLEAAKDQPGSWHRLRMLRGMLDVFIEAYGDDAYVVTRAH